MRIGAIQSLAGRQKTIFSTASINQMSCSINFCIMMENPLNIAMRRGDGSLWMGTSMYLVSAEWKVPWRKNKYLQLTHVLILSVISTISPPKNLSSLLSGTNRNLLVEGRNRRINGNDVLCWQFFFYHPQNIEATTKKGPDNCHKKQFYIRRGKCPPSRNNGALFPWRAV